MTDSQVIKLSKPIIDRLKSRKHPGQSFSGVIEELLDQCERISTSTPKGITK
jgi:predicted CopG family antitoxin